MPDWTKPMQQTYEYYIVDPATWRDTERLMNVKMGATISRDADADTLGSASFDLSESIGECYIRTYLVTIQNGIRERFPLGTHMVQTPSEEFDGKAKSVSVDAYTSLIELKENPPPLGFSIRKGEPIMDNVCSLTKSHARAPVIECTDNKKLEVDFVSNTDDNWLTFLKDLSSNAKYEYELDDLGQICFRPVQEVTALQPVVIFDDSNSSILLPSITISRDLYGIPNVVEILYSGNNLTYQTRVVNNDPNSPISTVNRGREIIRRVTNPSLTGNPTKAQIDEYARQLLKTLSTLEYTVSYSHGYYPVRVGDCVLLNYERAGILNQKAKIISQSIKCTTGCVVTEKAIYTNSLWG